MRASKVVVGRNIRKARQSRGWSCGELGERVGLTRGGISAIEVGRVYPGGETLLRLAQALDVSLDAIAPVARRRRQASPKPI